MPTLRLRADHAPVDLFHPAGHFESMPVSPTETVQVPGEVRSRTADAVVIGTNDDDQRAWPLAVWELVEAPRSNKTPEGK